MALKLYDLAAADAAVRFSPFCWRARFALAHKRLQADTVPWNFTDKDAIAFSGQGKVPVLVDGERAVHDSWDIAVHLENTYSDAPSLFPQPGGKPLARFVRNWVDTQVNLPVLQLVIMDIYEQLHEKDKAYFRESREQRFGTTLEQFAQAPDKALPRISQALMPLRLTLGDQPYLAGDQPAFADFIALSVFQWAGSVSSIALVKEDDPIHDWRQRLLDRYPAALQDSNFKRSQSA
ncbi:MAG: glutathione S-transferase N-terminal domain-containing protein [Ectothiorhodospiraceae bacterium]|nr:glutathione S-transferase N-terminal domain-containing protein [Ectothiorhodospiraceae bacterium]MCH8502800.1 glutathione S-transferase N-terminal domain-containing protein [Ectothiorhodospiraceae bacterium]